MASRPRLDRAAVIAAAEELVDRDGWAYLTMTALAAEVGVRTPSLYSHVESIEALLGDVQVRALEALGADVSRAVMGRSGADGVRALAAGLRDFSVRHPGRYELALSEPVDRPALQAAGRTAGEAFDAVVRSCGVANPPPELAFSCLAALHGVLALDRAGLYRGATLDLDAVYGEVTELVVALVVRAARDQESAVV